MGSIWANRFYNSPLGFWKVLEGPSRFSLEGLEVSCRAVFQLRIVATAALVLGLRGTLNTKP